MQILSGNVTKVTVKSSRKMSSIEYRGQTNNIDPLSWPIHMQKFEVKGYSVNG